MTFRSNLIPSAFVLVVATGCTTPAALPVVQRPTVAVVPAPRDKVWQSLVAVVGMEFPIQVIEKESGLISTRTSTMALPAAQWALDCDNPDDFLYPWNQLRMDLRVLVEEAGPGVSRVTLICHYEAYKQSTYPRAWTIVATNGTLEGQLLQKVQQRLSSR